MLKVNTQKNDIDLSTRTISTTPRQSLKLKSVLILYLARSVNLYLFEIWQQERKSTALTEPARNLLSSAYPTTCFLQKKCVVLSDMCNHCWNEPRRLCSPFEMAKLWRNVYPAWLRIWIQAQLKR